MQKFTTSEIKLITIILSILFMVSILNINASIRRGRDSIRKNDISAIQESLDTYLQKYKKYPESSENGEIIGCFENGPILDKISGYPTNAIVCKWGESRLESTNAVPRDPQYEKGARYLYIKTEKGYELYISLEGKEEAEYNETTVSKNLQCGTKICNYGKIVGKK